MIANKAIEELHFRIQFRQGILLIYLFRETIYHFFCFLEHVCLSEAIDLHFPVGIVQSRGSRGSTTYSCFLLPIATSMTSILAASRLFHCCMDSEEEVKVFLSYMGGGDTSNKPLEWTGQHHISTSPPQAPCLPLRGSVRLTT